MNLKTKWLVLSTCWMVISLILFNLFVYFFFLKTTTKSETELIWNKAQVLLRNPNIHNPANWNNPELFIDPIPEDSMIRIIDRWGGVWAEHSTDSALTRNPVVFRKNYHTRIHSDSGVRRIYIQVPIWYQKQQVGVLELGKSMRILSNYLGVLITALILTTLSVSALSILGNLLYSYVFFKPLRHLVNTMQGIQRSGTLRQLNGDFTARRDELGLLGRSFNRMIGTLQENEEKQKRFIADASHEMRTPLTVIQSYANLMKRWGEKDPKVREEAVEAIYSEALRLKRLTDALLRMAQIDQTETLDLVECRILPLIRSAAQDLAVAFGRHIEIMEPSADPVVAVDPDKFKQLVIILLENALKYSKKKITVQLTESGESVRLQIADAGIGIAPHELPRIFDRFYRSDPSRSRNPGGAGIGLSIAKQIVRLHGGTLNITSKKGRGTTVKVQLPLKI